MPGYDGTGPIGRGAMSGRGMGYCALQLAPGERPLAGRGIQGVNTGFAGRETFGRGGGRGWRNCFYATGVPGWQRWGYGAAGSKEDELELLKAETQGLKQRLAVIESQIQEEPKPEQT